MTHAGFASELIPSFMGIMIFIKQSAIQQLHGFTEQAGGVNCSLFGIGERTGNTPLEAMVFEYAQLKVLWMEWIQL